MARRDPADLQRESPETGLIDVAVHLNAITADGYTGYCEFELFAEHLCGREVESVVHQAAEFHRALNGAR